MVKKNFKKVSVYLTFAVFSFAVFLPWPAGATMYLPGQTLEPDCAPGSANCGVVSTTAAYFTATSTTVASTFPYASSTVLTVSGSSYLGTILSGTWNGTAIGVGYGGTGQTSFGQGWLHSDGTAISASTSPTVAWITATSTSATSTFYGLSANLLSITSSVASSTFANGINLTAGCFSVNGACIAGGSINDGTTGQLAYYASNGNAVSATSSVFLSAAGNFGIGTTSPYAKLSVSGETVAAYFTATTTATSTFTGPVNTSAITGGYKMGGTMILYASSTMGSTLVGVDAGRLLLSSDNSSAATAVGYGAMYSNTTGYNNTAVGYSALYTNTTGYDNVAVGYEALSLNISGSGNVALGNEALAFGKATNTTAVGYYSGYGGGSTVVQNSTFLGAYAGYAITTGNNNTAVGYKAGDNITTGSNNIVLGYDIDAPSASSNNTLNIGNLIFGANINGTGKNLSSGNIAIGTTTPWAKLSIQNTYGSTTPLFDVASSTSVAYATSTLFRINADGNIGIASSSPWRTLSVSGTMAASGLTTSGTGNALCISSSKEFLDAGGGTCTPSASRFKDNIEPMPAMLDKVLNLKPVTFNFKETGEARLGLIAEEVRQIEPRLTFDGNDGLIRGVRYEELGAVLAKAIQEQQSLIETIKSDISSLKGHATAKISGVSDQVNLDSIFSWTVDKLKNVFGIALENGKIETSKIKVKGIEMEDGLTGDIYCLRVYGGEITKSKGTCEETMAGSAASNPSSSSSTSSALESSSSLSSSSPSSLPPETSSSSSEAYSSSTAEAGSLPSSSSSSSSDDGAATDTPDSASGGSSSSEL